MSDQAKNGTIDLGEDDGFLAVRVAGEEVTLDVWRVNSLVYDFHQKHKDEPDDVYNDGLVELMTSLGLPRGSHRLAQRFVRAIGEQAALLKKKDSPSGGSPASTAAPIPAR